MSGARKYGVRRMDLHHWGDMCVDSKCEPMYTAEDFEALQAELAAVREALSTCEQLLDSISDMKPGKFSTEACAETALKGRDIARAALHSSPAGKESK